MRAARRDRAASDEHLRLAAAERRANVAEAPYDGAGSTAVTIAEPLSGLAPATTYYFCAIAQNSVATAFGSVLSFTTTAEPSVTTAAAASISALRIAAALA